MELIDEYERTAFHVLDRCLAAAADEEIVLLVDHQTDARVVTLLRSVLEHRRCRVVTLEIPAPQLPGEALPTTAARAVLHSDATIELTSLFLGSNQARRDANAAGARYLAMPGVELETFRADGPLSVDFDGLRSFAETIGEQWTDAREFVLTTPAGTHLSGLVAGRPGRVLHGICRHAGGYMAPPDIEAGTAPVEGTVNGIAVIDADLLFMGRGPLPDPVVLTFADGELIDVDGAHADRLRRMIERCDDARMSNLAEVSLGLNPRGTVCSVAMETESALGTAHIALGNSIAYGGVVDAVAHLDCVMKDATLVLDGVEVVLNPPPG